VHKNTGLKFLSGIIFSISLFFSTQSFGQKINDGMGSRLPHPVDVRRAVSSFNCGKIESTDTALVKEYLLSTIPNLRGVDFSIEYRPTEYLKREIAQAEKEFAEGNYKEFSSIEELKKELLS